MENEVSRNVITTDRRLEREHEASSEALAQHRWHWTRDETNPRRVSVRTYARAIGRGETTIRDVVNGYQEWLDQGARGAPRTLTEYMERAKVRGIKGEATEAVAKARGVGFGTARRHHSSDVEAVRRVAEGRAERRGTSVSEEIPGAADSLARANTMRLKRDAASKDRHTFRYFEVEKNLTVAKRALREAMTAAEGVDFTAEERDLLADAIGKVRGLLSLLDMRVTGTSGVDWDAELTKLGDLS